MIDLNNTWCEATENNYNALIKFGIRDNYYSCFKARFSKYPFNNAYIIVYDNEINLLKDGNEDKNFKQIHFVNGEFQYAEAKHKNNFEDYEFEADLEGEILKKLTTCYVGYIIKKNIIYSAIWDFSGNCIDNNDNIVKDFSLRPIKKEWYENADNFPCLVFLSKENKFMVLDKPLVPLKLNDKFRPATKEEILSLLVKE